MNRKIFDKKRSEIEEMIQYVNAYKDAFKNILDILQDIVDNMDTLFAHIEKLETEKCSS